MNYVLSTMQLKDSNFWILYWRLALKKNLRTIPVHIRIRGAQKNLEQYLFSYLYWIQILQKIKYVVKCLMQIQQENLIVLISNYGFCK
jgi:hypothetical protein